MPGLNGRSHQGLRSVLRLVGPLMAGTGLVFAIIGIVDFFSAAGTHEPPTKFWYAFVGVGLLGIGVAITKFAYLGSIVRYLANETAPVGKDVVNYMADGTKGAVRDVATAVGEGLAASRGGAGVEVVRCHKCDERNEATANFCKQCGASLGKATSCASCGELNDPDARFCDNCGKAMA